MADSSSNSFHSNRKEPHRIRDLENAESTPFLVFVGHDDTAEDVLAGRVGLLDRSGRKISKEEEVRKYFLDKENEKKQQPQEN